MPRIKNTFEPSESPLVDDQPISPMRSARKPFWIALALVVLIMVIAGVWVVSNMRAKNYSVVYLSSREIYIGRLQTFPRLVLKDAYILQSAPTQANPDDAQPSAKQELVPLSAKSWAVDKFYLNRDQILYYGPLSEESEALQAIRSKVK